MTRRTEYKGEKFDEEFRADLMVENLVMVELKSVERVTTAHKKQVLTGEVVQATLFDEGGSEPPLLAYAFFPAFMIRTIDISFLLPSTVGGTTTPL